MPKDSGERSHRGPVNRAGAAYIRSRTTSACQVCRTRRAKCDNERPCSNCRRLGVTCLPELVSKLAGFDPASLAILDKLDIIQTEVRSLSAKVRERPSQFSPADSEADAAPRASAVELHRHLQRGNLRQVLAWDVWQPDEAPRDIEALDLGGLPDNSPHSTSPNENSRTRSDSCLDLGRFGDYLDQFFRNVHILNPVLDEQQIRAQLTNFLLSGVGWDANSCLLLLLLANGASASDFSRQSAHGSHGDEDRDNWASAQALFEAAEKRKDVLGRSDYLTQARCQFYSGVFMMSSLRPFEAWRCFIQGLATCQILASTSHRHRLRVAAQAEAEESIYWSCWKSERELRFELDVPDFSCTRYDHPVMFPTLPQVTHHETLRAWYFYLAEISLWRYEMTARQSMYDCVKDGPVSLQYLAERIVDLDALMTSWQESLPEVIALDAHTGSDESDLLSFVLKGRLTYNYEVLTWPFVETLILFGQHQSRQANELAVRGVRVHYDRLSINRPGFYHRHHGTWLMQSSSARSVCVLLAVAKCSFAPTLPPDWVGLVADTIAMLEYWRQDPADSLTVFLRSTLRSLGQ